jgi:hypothetical protein
MDDTKRGWNDCSLTFDLLLPGAASEKDQEGEELPERDAACPTAAAAHQAEDLLPQAPRDPFSQHRAEERLHITNAVQ